MFGIKAKFKLEGMSKLQQSFKKLGKVPQKHVTASARKGVNVVLRAAKEAVPFDTGNLKRGIKLAGEKSKTKGKKVYRIVFDRAMNDIFQKRNSEGDVIAYYPISQEYGYFTRNGRYIPGFRFIRGSFEDKSPKMAQTIVDTMKTKMEQEIAKEGLR